jgi:hypothetical protein
VSRHRHTRAKHATKAQVRRHEVRRLRLYRTFHTEHKTRVTPPHTGTSHAASRYPALSQASYSGPTSKQLSRLGSPHTLHAVDLGPTRNLASKSSKKRRSPTRTPMRLILAAYAGPMPLRVVPARGGGAGRGSQNHHVGCP